MKAPTRLKYNHTEAECALADLIRNDIGISRDQSVIAAVVEKHRPKDFVVLIDVMRDGALGIRVRQAHTS